MGGGDAWGRVYFDDDSSNFFQYDDLMLSEAPVEDLAEASIEPKLQHKVSPGKSDEMRRQSVLSEASTTASRRLSDASTTASRRVSVASTTIDVSDSVDNPADAAAEP